jgi:hypothetical protein
MHQRSDQPQQFLVLRCVTAVQQEFADLDVRDLTTGRWVGLVFDEGRS